METDCLFCKIIAGKIPAEKIYEDGTTLAFLDINPVNRGHTLVIPKEHFPNIYTIPRDYYERLMGVVHKLAPQIKTLVSADGVNIGMNNDGAAGQVIFHAHIHIIPRFSNDGHKHWHGEAYKQGEIEEMGKTLRESLVP